MINFLAVENVIVRVEVVTKRASITFTSNSKREFVPNDQVFPLLCYCSLLLHINWSFYAIFYPDGFSELF